jgi:hypothetical protein
LPYCYIDSSEEGEAKEKPAVRGTAPTSTSSTIVLSEEHRTATDSSPPPQQNTEASTPPASPRARAPKKARNGAGDTQEIVAGSSLTPLLDDVSSLFPWFAILCCLSIFLFLPTFLTYVEFVTS